MQAPAPPTLTDFGMALKPQAFRADKLALTPEIEIAIETALCAALNDITGAGLPADLPPSIRRQILARTMTALMRQKRFAEAAHFAAAAEPFPVLVRLKLQAIYNLGAFEDFISELATQEADPTHPDWLRHAMFTLRLRHARLGLPVRPCDHGFFMDTIPETWEAALAGLSGPVRPGDPKAQLDQLAAQLLCLRDDPADDAADFTRRLAWGQNMQTYCQFLRRIRAQNTASADPTAGRLQSLLRELNARVAPDDTPSMAQAIAEGRSVLLSTAHAGVKDVEPFLFNRIAMKTATISSGHHTELQDTDRLTLGAQGDFQTDFLKLVKIVKKSPHLIRIFPDGNNGGDLLDFELLGRRISLGQGAATLAWHARAATFFTGTKWEGPNIRIYLRTGPVARREMGREAFDRAFYDFYLDCLKEIVLGAPEDMVGIGGFWPALMTSSQV